MGLVLLGQFLMTLPDGKLHITICDVGQGDGAYLRFPDGRDIVIDGGPGSQILTCLGKVMPFWDRTIDAVMLTHPDLDHFKGLIPVLQRYRVGTYIHSDIANTTPLYQELESIVKTKHIPVRFVASHEKMKLGDVTLGVLWPAQTYLSLTNNVLGTQSDTAVSRESHRNDYAIVFHLRYGIFDAVFTADADENVEPYYTGEFLSPDGIELLKVPHHGSRTGMTDAFLSWLHPKYAVISVGAKNTYGHPSPQAIEQLTHEGATIFRTDQRGSITFVTDGKTVSIRTEKKQQLH